jgi:hypothetical protein
MHYALGIDNSNPLSQPTKKVIKYLQNNGRKTFKELMGEFWEVLPNRANDLTEILEFLLAQNRIELIRDEHPITKSPVNFYEAKPL